MSLSLCSCPGTLPPTQHHLWVLLSFALTTQLPAGNQLAGRGDSSSPEAGHGVQCGPASNPTTSWGQATGAAACNFGGGRWDAQVSFDHGVPRGREWSKGLENQSLPHNSLGDREDKNIYGQFSSLWGRPGTEQGCFFPWLWLTSQDGGS